MASSAKGLSSEDPKQRIAALEALCKDKPALRREEAAIIGLLEDKAANVRRAAIAALASDRALLQVRSPCSLLASRCTLLHTFSSVLRCRCTRRR
jgi:HEAT repeat protein